MLPDADDRRNANSSVKPRRSVLTMPAPGRAGPSPAQTYVHRYVFTAEYTATLDTGHRRERAVMTACEPKEHAADAALGGLVTAPDDLSVVEQYAYLRSRGWACG